MFGIDRVGKGIKEPLLVLHHQGSLPAFLSSVYLLPESRSDTVDWLSQLLLEALLDNPDQNDYVSLAKSSAQVFISLWPGIKKELKEHQALGTLVKPLCEYTGTYYDIVRTWWIDVFDDSESLYMYFQGIREKYYQLDHNHSYQFSWLLTRNEDVHRARFPSTFSDFYIFRFGTNSGDTVDRLTWRHDLLVPKGEKFTKKNLDEGLRSRDSTSRAKRVSSRMLRPCSWCFLLEICRTTLDSDRLNAPGDQETVQTSSVL